MAYLPFLRERSPQHKAFSPFQFTSNKLGIPNPKFKVGDRVKYRYICDDRLDTENYLKLQINYGLIIWMAPNPKDQRWEIYVLWDDESPKYFDFHSPHWSDGDDLEFA
ncbi:hypothetical protein [Planktothrix mougeotii]|uniref:Uncharacterized protein n=1 Tax=Planktothrix mougeotii LEGE 06226 TaxID=1828728 RepID=A0ABR9UFK8_9CYAN|nr:hypothetical protein [Planktothrix mougeotii]MBE9144911.1 hypothetical protein [Planktothrix mougeotii LEGE 06226]